MMLEKLRLDYALLLIIENTLAYIDKKIDT